MKKIKIIEKLKKGFKGSIKIMHKDHKDPFGVIKIKKPLKIDTPIYIFLFQLIEQQLEPVPQLSKGRFTEVFANSIIAKGEKETEKDISVMFGREFIAYTY